MKIGQKDRRGQVWTAARARALKRAQIGRKKAWKSYRKSPDRGVSARTKQPLAARRAQAAAETAAKHGFRLNIHLAELIRLIARDELRDMLRRIK